MKYSIIPAAGLATRFLPASKCVPKELFPVFDKPAIQYIVEESVDAGIPGIVFVTGEGKEAILDHFDKINPKFPVSRLNEEIKKEVEKLDSMIDVVSVRQKNPKGLGHAVLTGTEPVKNESFAVMLPDMLVISKGKDSAMKKMVQLHKETGKSVIALMKVPHEKKSSYGIAEGIKVDENTIEITKMIEKPSPDETDSNLAIVGRYIFTPEIIEILQTTDPGKGGEIQLTDAMVELMNKDKVLGLIIDDDNLVFDTGNGEGFVLANIYSALQKTSSFSAKANDIIEKHDTLNRARFDERPWGWWRSLDFNEGNFQVKHIFVAPKGKLSLQKHKHRSEIWTVVEGSGFITIGETIHPAKKGDVFRIEIGEIHRAEGGEDGMHIIEVQLGDYLGEDDIIRIEDIYGRS